jgi:hypothetical protein
MVAHGRPNGIVQLSGIYTCTCRLRQSVTLSKGERFPGHIKTEVWVWGPWPRRRGVQNLPDDNDQGGVSGEGSAA